MRALLLLLLLLILSLAAPGRPGNTCRRDAGLLASVERARPGGSAEFSAAVTAFSAAPRDWSTDAARLLARLNATLGAPWVKAHLPAVARQVPDVAKRRRLRQLHADATKLSDVLAAAERRGAPGAAAAFQEQLARYSAVPVLQTERAALTFLAFLDATFGAAWVRELLDHILRLLPTQAQRVALRTPHDQRTSHTSPATRQRLLELLGVAAGDAAAGQQAARGATGRGGDEHAHACPAARRVEVGGSRGPGSDGSYTLCARPLLPPPPPGRVGPGGGRRCVAYSFGVGGDFSFDDALGRAPFGCRVFSFDHTMPVSDSSPRCRGGRSGGVFSRIGLGTTGRQHENLWSLSAIAARFGHTRVDVIKVSLLTSAFSFFFFCLLPTYDLCVSELTSLLTRVWTSSRWTWRLTSGCPSRRRWACATASAPPRARRRTARRCACCEARGCCSSSCTFLTTTTSPSARW